jgi:hypothetical protein
LAIQITNVKLKHLPTKGFVAGLELYAVLLEIHDGLLEGLIAVLKPF